MKPHELARRFLGIADRDFTAFKALKNSPGVSSVSVCFHAQQAVEKSLKAVLILNRIEFKRTHDLIELFFQI